MTIHRHSIVDLSVPTVDAMAQTLETIDRLLAEHRTIYLHCWGGVGRTGTVVACWLLRHGLATRETVLDELATLRRRDAERGHRPSPESTEQRDFVLAWRGDGEGSVPPALRDRARQ